MEIDILTLVAIVCAIVGAILIAIGLQKEHKKEKEILAKVESHNKRMNEIEKSDLDYEGKTLAITHGLYSMAVMTYSHSKRMAELHEELDYKLKGPSLRHWEEIYCHKNTK